MDHNEAAAAPAGNSSRILDREEDERSAVGATDVEVDHWAERERRRREAWLSGPSEDERMEWAREERRRRRTGRGNEDLAHLGPTDEEVEAWTARERRRREAWLAGPSEDERHEWARRERRRRERDDDYSRDDRYSPRRLFGRIVDDPDLEHTANRMRKDVIHATEGALDLLLNLPYRTVSRLVRAGRDWEDEDRGFGRPGRIRYSDDD